MQEPTRDNKTELKRLQTDMLIMDSDMKKKLRKKEAMMAEIKKLKRQEDMLRVEITSKEQGIKKIDSDIFGLAGEMNSLKKKINLL